MKQNEVYSIYFQLFGAFIVYFFMNLIDFVLGEPFDWFFTFFYWDIMLVIVLIIHATRHQRQNL